MSDAAPFPVQLEAVVFTKVSVVAVPEHEPNGEALAIAPQNRIEVTPDDQRPNMFVVSMTTIMNPESSKEAPYNIDVNCTAVLRVAESLDANEARKAATITGHSVVYGAIRECVTWLTARQPYGPLVLGLSVLQPSQPGAPKAGAPKG